MSDGAAILWATLFIGLGATLVMDLWAVLLRRAFGIPALDYALVGRWLGHMPAGRFAHEAIFAATPVRGERPIGWIAHFAIGVGYAGAFILIVGPEWVRNPTVWPALLFGLATVAAPFLVMQPAFGFGIAASKFPSPWTARARSLATHAIFGLGLFGAALFHTRVFAGVG